MRCVEDKVALGQVLIPGLQFFPVGIIALTLHTGIHLHSTFHHNKWVIFFYVHGSVHRDSMSIIVQRDATIYNLLCFCKLLYMFRVVTSPIIRSTYNCNYSIWHWSNRLCYLLLWWRSWNCGRPAPPDHDQQHCYHHAPTVKPETATAVVELLMMGVRTPETC
jgi:hypothetical protein